MAEGCSAENTEQYCVLCYPCYNNVSRVPPWSAFPSFALTLLRLALGSPEMGQGTQEQPWDVSHMRWGESALMGEKSRRALMFSGGDRQFV